MKIVERWPGTTLLAATMLGGIIATAVCFALMQCAISALWLLPPVVVAAFVFAMRADAAMRAELKQWELVFGVRCAAKAEPPANAEYINGVVDGAGQTAEAIRKEIDP